MIQDQENTEITDNDETSTETAANPVPTPKADVDRHATEMIEHEPTIEELQSKLAETEQKAQDNWEKAVRTLAEMENLRKRTQRDLENAHKYALENFARSLLPVLDSIVLGLQAASGDSPEVQKFREGNELTLREFEKVFAKFNIEAIDPLGQPFNADHHQAMMMQEVEGAAPNSVVNVFQKGYLLNGRLLRPAMVVVAKASEQPQANAQTDGEQA